MIPNQSPRTAGFLLRTLLLLIAAVAGEARASVPNPGEPDSLAILSDRLSRFCRRVPQEQVFVHMDNVCYHLGDTIYYKAYVLRADSLLPTDLSEVLHVELLNQDGYLVERQMLRLRAGEADGSFTLPDTLYAGFYELRAYTRWQLNWGAFTHPHSRHAHKWFLREDMAEDYFCDYEKLYSRVFPIYDKCPASEPGYTQEMTPRPLRRYYRKKEREGKATVTFYPEGGAWVTGAGQDIAFEANDDEGRHLQGHLSIQDGEGRTLAEADTEHRGRGTVTLRGQAGAAYKALFTWGEGQTATFSLPQCMAQGVILSARERQDTLLVTLHREGLGQAPLGLTLLVGGRFILGQRLESDTLALPLAGLPAGVAQLTVYDGHSRVWADRLLFLHQAAVPAGNVAVGGEAAGHPLAPYACRELSLQAPGPGRVSVAVYDRGTGITPQDNGTMLTEMLLASQVRGFVEDPLYYFREADSTRRRHLDLLLRVQGWRRYRWEEMTQGFTLREPFEISSVIRGDMSKYQAIEQEDYFYHEPSERLPILKESQGAGGTCGPKIEDILRPTGTDTGRVLREALERDKMELYSSVRADPADFQFLSKMRKEGVVRAEYALATKGENSFGQRTVPTKDGRFFIQAPHVDSPFFLYLIGADQGEVRQMKLDGDDYPKYSVRVRPFFPRFVHPYGYYQVHPSGTAAVHSPKASDDSPGEPDVTGLKEVEVKGGRGLRRLNLDKPVLVRDAYEAFNETVDAGLSPAWYAGSLSFTLNLARLYIGEMRGTDRAYDLERRWNGRDATFNIPQADQLRYNHLRNLHQVRIYTDYAPRLEGDPRYGASDQPSVTVSLECLPDNTERTTYRDRRYLHRGYNVCEDFYQPHYETLPPEGHKDHRRTLYWNPAVQLDGQGRATIRFYGSGRETSPVVTIEGTAEDGTLLSGRR